jgi:hypothetical protein
MTTYSAYLNVMFHGYVEEGDENYHLVVLEKDSVYDLMLEPDDDDVDFDLYLTDENGEIWYQDEDADSGAAVEIHAVYTGINRIYVKAHSGSSEYSVTIVEHEEEGE